jgi:hypothetical protein
MFLCLPSCLVYCLVLVLRASVSALLKLQSSCLLLILFVYTLDFSSVSLFTYFFCSLPPSLFLVSLFSCLRLLLVRSHVSVSVCLYFPYFSMYHLSLSLFPISVSWFSNLGACFSNIQNLSCVGPKVTSVSPTALPTEGGYLTIMGENLGRSHGQVGPKAAMGYFTYFRSFLSRVFEA